MGDEELVIETTEAFLKDIQNSLEQMKVFSANQQWDDLGRLAHKIKPSLTYMGMERGRELIVDIEEEANSDSTSADIADKIVEFEEICDQAIKELSSKVEELKA
jgi:HPt (histidine-containing phosphotransfer) domain-containing protein